MEIPTLNLSSLCSFTISGLNPLVVTGVALGIFGSVENTSFVSDKADRDDVTTI